MAAITLLSVGTTAIAANSNAEVVEAKTVSRKLKRNAAIYTSHGKRTHKKYLKKGMKIKIYRRANIAKIHEEKSRFSLRYQ